MARLRKRDDREGKFELDYLDVDGRRYRINTGTSEKRLATLWLNRVEELLTQARLGIIDKVGRIDADVIASKERRKQSLTLEQFKETYEERARHDIELSESTIATTGFAMESFISVSGNKLLADVTDNDVIKWKKKLAQDGKSKTTLSIYHRQIRTAFNRAVKWKMAESNPFVRVEVSKYGRDERKNKDMSYEEVRALLKIIDKENDMRFGKYVRFVLYTGCRRNEILFLRYENIHIAEMSLTVWADKTGKKLTIPVNKALKRVIDGMELREKGYVFQTHSNTRGVKDKDQPWHEDYVSRQFKKYTRKLGFPEHYTLHSLRHTYATYLRGKGVPLDIVQKLLGHASSRTTSENYDHSIALHFRAQADLIDFEEDKAG